MPSSFLWSVSNDSKVYLLSTKDNQWQQLSQPEDEIKLKRVSAVNRFLWALGVDGKIYLYVVNTKIQIPIRYKEVVYQNQRSYPGVGFCDSLLPLDRPRWSNEDGVISRDRDKIKLPSSSWKWDNEWTIEDNLLGQALGHEGWMYASDFKSAFVNDEKAWTFVRRRCWFRYRIFFDKNRWIPILDSFPETFNDISAGGLDIPGGVGDKLCVWAVTSQGQVAFRQGVTFDNPEGNGWIHIANPKNCKIQNISVGLTGLVWAITDSGKPLVRSGVVRQTLTGTSWVEVDLPEDDCHLLQVCVGFNSVWAVDRDHSVWLRRGIRGNESGTNVIAARGSSWVKMVGKMSVITVGANDQVWAVECDEPSVVYFRTGITPTDVGGKTWKPLKLSFKQRFDSTNGNLGMMVTDDQMSEADSGISQSCSIPREKCDIDLTSKFKCDINSNCPNGKESLVKRNYLSRSSTQGSSISTVEEFLDDSTILFELSWLSGSACFVDPFQVPDCWFQSNILTDTVDAKLVDWRSIIQTELSVRYEREQLNFNHEKAIDRVPWKKCGPCLIMVKNSWIECCLELEQIIFSHGEHVSTLTVSFKKETIKIDLINITSVMIDSSHENQHSFNVHLKPNNNSNVSTLRFAFVTETDLEDWVAVISSACCEIVGFTKTPSEYSLWATTLRGDIFAQDPAVHDFSPSLNERFWRQFGGHLKVIETCSAGVVWGIGFNNVPYIYTGGWGGGFFKGMATSSSGIFLINDTRQMCIYENQRWFPLAGFRNLGQYTDSSGKIKYIKENCRLPSLQWQWETDWQIDYRTPGGVDSEGWQYAVNFGSNFHARIGSTDYVRRRKWHRTCKLTTSGPWKKIESDELIDISFQVYPPKELDARICTWAVDKNGNALYRHGVTKKTPHGTNWELVKGDVPFISVSVGLETRVWVVSRDGLPYFRIGIDDLHPIGTMWESVGPPDGKIFLRQISVGYTSVWAVDTNGGLWYRENVAPRYPVGSKWKFVRHKVHKVSVGPDDQVWIITKSTKPSPVSSYGYICRRKGITNDDKIGTAWEYGPEGGWNHITARGCLHYSIPEKFPAMI